MKILALAFFVTLALSTVVKAQQVDTWKLASQLGDLLASEEFCGLSYDQKAISAFVDSKVAADDMAFTSILRMMTEGSRMKQNAMSKSSRTAHCAQTKRTAKANSFIK